jgi:membrane protein implicated in regulation of membrane protease activity
MVTHPTPWRRPSDNADVILLAGLVIGFLVVPDGWTVPVVVLAGVLEAAETMWEVRFSRRGRPRVGVETLSGGTGRVEVACRPVGSVRIRGETWTARCDHPNGADEGARVRVVGRDRLTLLVEPASGDGARMSRYPDRGVGR